MATTGNKKMKLLRIWQILCRETNETHILSAPDIADRLAEFGIEAERKSIYSDIELLKEAGKDLGLDIIQVKGEKCGYYVKGRVFDLAELKLLVDAVQASNFITKERSRELIKKLESLTDRYDASQLQRQVYIDKRPKTENEAVFANVDSIHKAIATNTQIEFLYTQYQILPSGQKKQVHRHQAKPYHVSPWAVSYTAENYYLIGYSETEEGTGKIKHFRIDRIVELHNINRPRNGKKEFESFDLPAYTKKTFGMFSGTDEKITLICDNALASVIIDRFGADKMLHPVGNDHFRVGNLEVSVSKQFFGWLAGLGTQARIESPERVKQAYTKYLSELQQLYQSKETAQ